MCYKYLSVFTVTNKCETNFKERTAKSPSLFLKIIIKKNNAQFWRESYEVEILIPGFWEGKLK